MNGVSTEDYLKLLGTRITNAEESTNVDECIRLAEIGIKALHEYIDKCKKYQAAKN